LSNSINFVGRLGADAELKHVGDHMILEFTIANNTGFGDKAVTNWFRCSMWGNRGQKIESYMRKGTQVFVTGELRLRPYTNKEGIDKLSADVRVNEIDFCGSRQDSDSSSSPLPDSSRSSAPAPAPETDEDMPF